ncbi:hypothetical protein HPB51_027022 [Rhipicephalus microplus]|uniref:Cytochrome n=1 Tax=Rhipicephalus microplus TaxID=6941 RepID=A0A9J6D1L8_RHIMP|nr:hypothetical protein HPB51_027022 [Rhipicephalus microplus]
MLGDLSLQRNGHPFSLEDLFSLNRSRLHDLLSLNKSRLKNKHKMLQWPRSQIIASWFHPIVPGVNRKINHDVVMSGYLIPANTVLRTEPFVAGRLEENFTRASEFLPERWLRSSDDISQKTSDGSWQLHPFASLPFSIGPRMCIGRRVAEMEITILVAQVLKRYRVENHHGDIGFLTQFTAKPERPARFRFVEL